MSGTNHPAKYTPKVSARINALLEDTKGPPSPQLAKIPDLELLEHCLVYQNELFRRAKAGHDESADYIFRLGVRTSKLLIDLARNPSAALMDIAHASPVWPFLYSPKKGLLGEYKPIMEALEVGRDSQLNVNPKTRWSWEGDARKWAMKIYACAHELKASVKGTHGDHPGVAIEWPDPLLKAAFELPPLTKASSSFWMEKFGWPFILKETGGHPELHPDLRKLGIHRKHHSTAESGRTGEVNVRDGIKKLVTQALASMASPP